MSLWVLGVEEVVYYERLEPIEAETKQEAIAKLKELWRQAEDGESERWTSVLIEWVHIIRETPSRENH